MVEQLKSMPSTSKVEIQILDFSDSGIESYLKENNIKELPAFIFSTKNFDTSKDPTVDPTTGQVTSSITNYLTELPSGEYSLVVFQP
jgi:hypothetical protein